MTVYACYRIRSSPHVLPTVPCSCPPGFAFRTPRSWGVPPALFTTDSQRLSFGYVFFCSCKGFCMTMIECGGEHKHRPTDPGHLHLVHATDGKLRALLKQGQIWRCAHVSTHTVARDRFESFVTTLTYPMRGNAIA